MKQKKFVIGGVVESLASKVLNKMECHCLFGSLGRTTMIPGVIVEVKKPQNKVSG
jgi:hypothetical protein